MKRILILVAISLLLCSTASAFQGGGGESTKKKATPTKNSGATSDNTTPARPTVPPARPKTPTVASLMVNSQLPNATVTINGRTAGTTDSNGYLVLGSLKPGVYNVTITKPGYQPDKKVVNLSAGQSETLNFEPKPITQGLTISTTPPECEVYLDEVLRGRTDSSGNVKFADVPVGEHRVTIRKSRYREATFPLSLSLDKEGRINANLELGIGFLTVTTNAPNPSVDISGIGHFDNSLSKVECPPGTYTVTISSPLYVMSRKEVSVSAGQEALLSLTLEVDSAARNRLISEAREAYSGQQYDRAIGLANTLISADSKNSQALTVLAQSYFMKDDFNSFTEFGSRAIEAGGSVEVSLKHHHEFFAATNMHAVRLVIDAQSVTYDPQVTQLPAGSICPNPPFKVSLAILGGAEVSGNRKNEIYLRLTFVDPNKPKKSNSLRFGDRASYFEKVRKAAAGGLVSYIGETMVSREQALGAMSALAELLNRVRARWKAGIESSIAANKSPEVILDSGGSDPVPGSTPTLPTVESILVAYITAGGNRAWTTTILKGTYTYTIAENGNSISGDFEEYLKGRTKFLYAFKNEKIGSFIEEGYDAGVGWYKVYKKKPSPMSSLEIASAKRGLVLSFLTDVKEFNETYPAAILKGKGKLGELEVYVVETNSSDGRLETFYFDTTTGLLMRKDAKYEDPEKKGVIVTTRIIYDGYLDVGGIKVPTGWRQVSPTVTLTVKISDTKFDIPIDDTKFKMPPK